jgi:predicted Zn-dependent protease
VALEKKIAIALEFEKMAMRDKRITKSSGSSYGESTVEIFISSSAGFTRSYKASACSPGVSVVEMQTGGM